MNNQSQVKFNYANFQEAFSIAKEHIRQSPQTMEEYILKMPNIVMTSGNKDSLLNFLQFCSEQLWLNEFHLPILKNEIAEHIKHLVKIVRSE